MTPRPVDDELMGLGTAAPRLCPNRDESRATLVLLPREEVCRRAARQLRLRFRPTLRQRLHALVWPVTVAGWWSCVALCGWVAWEYGELRPQMGAVLLFLAWTGIHRATWRSL